MLVSILRNILSGRKKNPHSNLEALAAAGRNACRAGDTGTARELFAEVLRSDPFHGEALVVSGMLALQDEQPQLALTFLDPAVQRYPADPEIQLLRGRALLALGDRAAAGLCGENALRLRPGIAGAHDLIAAAELPGEYYFDVLSRIHGLLRPETYVEIGVAEGQSIRRANPETAVIGVDPAPAITFALGPNVRIFRMTSDDFFARHDLAAELGGKAVELAFIDGMHLFEFALRDFINLERFCTRASTILVHDCYPLNRITAERDRCTPFWSGDIWRLVLALKKYRPDISVQTIATPPTGLGVIRRLAPGSTVLGDNYDMICSEFLALDYGVLDKDKPGMLGLVPNDWDQVRRILG